MADRKAKEKLTGLALDDDAARNFKKARASD
jgi:hypothetical protein